MADNCKPAAAAPCAPPGPQSYRPVNGARPVGMAILPGELPPGDSASADNADSDSKSVGAPWVLLVTAKVRPRYCFRIIVCIMSATNLWVAGQRSGPHGREVTTLFAGEQGMAKRLSVANLPISKRGLVGTMAMKTNAGDQLVGLHVVGFSGIFL